MFFSVLYGSLVCGVTLAGLHVLEGPVRIILSCCCVIPMVFLIGTTTSLVAVVLKNLYFIPLQVRLTGVLEICDLWFLGIHFVMLWCRQLKQSMHRGYFCFSEGSQNNDLLGEGTLVISNHCNSQLDWMNAAELAYCIGTSPSHLKAYMKHIIKYIPVMGWIGVLLGNICLSRSWDKDRSVICNELKERVLNWPKPTFIAMYPEGTRLTRKKLLQAQEFAREKRLVELRHLLQPRVKGFMLTLRQLRELGYTQIIDLTSVPSPRAMDFKEVLMGKFHFVHAHIKVIQMKDLPENDLEVKSWLRNRWVQKDELIQFRKDGNKWKGVEIPFQNYYYSSSALYAVHALLYYKLLSILFPTLVAVTWLSGASVCLFYVLMRSQHTSAIRDSQKYDLKTE